MTTTSIIQVDMFEVQLGASVLLQFRNADGDVVRVLADGGQGLPFSDITKKLPGALAEFSNERRIDLLIGTHYDADHLDRLVPIIEDPTTAITEAWLPPVANDTQPHHVDDELDDEQFLAQQLSAPDGDVVLARYLAAKAQVCALLRPFPDERIPSKSVNGARKVGPSKNYASGSCVGVMRQSENLIRERRAKRIRTLTMRVSCQPPCKTSFVLVSSRSGDLTFGRTASYIRTAQRISETSRMAYCRRFSTSHLLLQTSQVFGKLQPTMRSTRSPCIRSWTRYASGVSRSAVM